MRYTFPDGAIFSTLIPWAVAFCRVVNGEVIENLAYRTKDTTHEGFLGNLLTPEGEITKVVMLFEGPYPATAIRPTYENETTAIVPQSDH